MRRLSYVMVMGALLMMAVTAKAPAAPITVSAGEEAVFNFDFPGTETFALIHVWFGLTISTAVQADDAGHFYLFDDLDAVGSPLSLAIYNGGAVPLVRATNAPEATDGASSVRLVVTTGSVTLNRSQTPPVPMGRTPRTSSRLRPSQRFPNRRRC